MTSTLDGSTPYCCRMILSRLTLAWRLADHADAASGKLADLGDLGTGLLALAALRRRRPHHHEILAQRRDRLRILRHVEIAADDGEVDLALRELLGAGDGAVGLHRLQPDIGAMLGEGLRQRLHDLDVVAVRRADRDAQRHRPFDVIICAHEHADDGQHAGQRHEHRAPCRRTRRSRRRRPVLDEVLSHGSRKQSFDAQIHSYMTYWNNMVANFLPATGYICVMVTGTAGVRVKFG